MLASRKHVVVMSSFLLQFGGLKISQAQYKLLFTLRHWDSTPDIHPSVSDRRFLRLLTLTTALPMARGPTKPKVYASLDHKLKHYIGGTRSFIGCIFRYSLL